MLETPNITIRPATPADALGVAEVQVATWQSSYQGYIDKSYLDTLRAPAWEENWDRTIKAERLEGTFFVATQNNEVIGFCHGGKEREKRALGYDTELYSIYVHPQKQGLGIGRKLLMGFARARAELGGRSLVLWTLESGPSHPFYLRMGGQRLAPQTTFNINGKDYTEVAYGWDDIQEL